MQKTVISSMIFLILGSGCAAPVTKFDANWEIVQIPGNPPKACLPEKDVLELREILIRCEGNGAKK